MTSKQKFGLIVAASALAAGAFVWYKNRAPKFKILSFNNQERTVKWQYGSIVNVSHAGQNATYSSEPNSNFFVNVAPITNDGKDVGIRFNFLGNDTRDPEFIYFE